MAIKFNHFNELEYDKNSSGRVGYQPPPQRNPLNLPPPPPQRNPLNLPPPVPARKPLPDIPPLPARMPPPPEISFDDLIPVAQPQEIPRDRINVNTGISFDDLIPAAQASQAGANFFALPQEQPQEQSSFDGIDFTASPKQVRAQIAKLPQDQRKAALDKWADVSVAKNRSTARDGSYILDTLQNLGHGTPIGSWLDEGDAALTSGLHYLTGGYVGAPYDEALAYAQAETRARDRESTRLGELPYIGDVTAGGVTKLVGGVASGLVLPVANIAKGATFVPSAVNTGATAAGYGALYGSGQGDAVDERMSNAATGAALGGALGVGGQAVSSLAGAALRGTTARAQLPDIGGRKISRGATDRVQRAFNDDLAAELPNIDRRYWVKSAQLGDEGMLADYGSNLTGQASAIASQPGRAQSIVTGALEARARTAQGRINESVDNALGAPVNLPELSASVDTAAKQIAKPYYDQFFRTQVPMTKGLKATVQRAYALDPSLERNVSRLIQADGVSPEIAKNNSIQMHYIKVAMDSYASTMTRQGDKNRARIAKGISSALRKQVDEALSPGNPSNSSWAKGRAAVASARQFDEGLEQGKGLLDNKVSANEFRQNLSRLNDMQREGVRLQARNDVRQKMTTAKNALTNQEGASATAGRKILSSEDTRGKLREIVGNDAARQLTRTLDAEGRMAETYNKVTGNSATAARLAAQKEFPNAVKDELGTLGTRSGVGVIMEGAARLGRYLTAGAMDEKRLRVAQEAALILTQRGVSRDKIARELLNAARKQGANDAKMKRLRQFVKTSVLATTATRGEE